MTKKQDHTATFKFTEVQVESPTDDTVALFEMDFVLEKRAPRKLKFITVIFDDPAQVGDVSVDSLTLKRPTTGDLDFLFTARDDEAGSWPALRQVFCTLMVDLPDGVAPEALFAATDFAENMALIDKFFELFMPSAGKGPKNQPDASSTTDNKDKSSGSSDLIAGLG